ncbi:FRG domain-containing protein [Pseudokineococcus sp. 1T1Z-3]|uniref:FRG domain-containing protein n=1 Tax=Pseudokineococcus sp. 1T1Z-3 TaxID=3132745 RepID=UPI0030B5FDC5
MSPATRNHWLSSGWGYRPNGQDALLRAITRIGSLQAGRRYVWRGVADATWRVQSSLWRHLDKHAPGDAPYSEQLARAAERDALRRAREWGLGLHGATHLPDLQLLASLQHHSLPTRLLDVTANPYTALWFACASDLGRDNVAGALLAFDVTDLPVQRTIPLLPAEVMTWAALESTPSSNLLAALEASTDSRRPFLVEPTVRDDRMAAQEGLFLASAFIPDTDPDTGLDGLELTHEAAPGHDRLGKLFAPTERGRGAPHQLPFCALVIKPRTKKAVRGHLAGTYARDLKRLFPDIGGLAQDFGQDPGVVTIPATETAPSDETKATPRPPVDDPS